MRQKNETLNMIEARQQRAADEIRERQRPIRLSATKQYWSLFFCRCCAKRQARTFYSQGCAALERDLDVIRLVKNNKNLVTLSRCSFITDSVRMEHLRHAKDNVIDLDLERERTRISIQAID